MVYEKCLRLKFPILQRSLQLQSQISYENYLEVNFVTFIVVQYCTVLDLRNKLKEAFVMGQSCCTYENRPNTWDQPFLWSRIIWDYCHYVGIQVVRKKCWRLKRAKLILISIPFKVVCTFYYLCFIPLLQLRAMQMILIDKIQMKSFPQMW